MLGLHALDHPEPISPGPPFTQAPPPTIPESPGALTHSDLSTTMAGVSLVGFLGSIASIRAYPGSTEWDKWRAKMIELARGLDPVFTTGRTTHIHKSHEPVPTVTETDLENLGIQHWLNKVNKYARNTDAHMDSYFNLLDKGFGLPDTMDPQRYALQKRHPEFFTRQNLPVTNSALAKLEIMRGLLIREFGRTVSKATTQAQIDAMTLKPVSVGALQAAFINARRIAESMGKSEKDTQELSMEWFTQWLQKRYPAQMQALSAEYSINVRLLGGDLAETTSQNILEQPDPTQFDKTLKDLTQLRSKYDNATPLAGLSPPPDRPFQEFPPVAAMAAQVQPPEWTSPTNPAPSPSGGWSPNHGPSRPHRHYGPADSSPQPGRGAPRELHLPDISALFAGTSGVTCHACGCGGHVAKECTWIFHQALPAMQPYISAFMQAHGKGDVYFKAVLTQIRNHGFLATWSEAECAELVADTVNRAQRRRQDPNRADFEANKSRYGSSPTHPHVTRQHTYGTSPAWMTQRTENSPTRPI